MERHPVDMVALGGGIIFALIAGLALGGVLDDAAGVAWLVPAALVVIALGLLGSVVRARR